MPNAYQCPSDPKTKVENKTGYQVIVGPGALFEEGKAITIRDVTDGTSNTIMVAESKNLVNWTAPEDLAEATAAGSFGSNHSGGVNAVFADGSVKFLKKSINPQTLQGLITRGGGEVIGSDY